MLYNNLSFVTSVEGDDKICDLWSVESTDNWTIDNQRGGDCADELIQLIGEQGNPSILGHVIKAMFVKGRWSGVEVGFSHRIAERLMREAD